MQPSSAEASPRFETLSPLLGSGILVDKIETTDAGKINAYGVITVFWAWGFPCSRRCQAVVTLLGLSQGTTTILVSYAGPGMKESSSIGKAEIKVSQSNNTLTVPLPVNCRFFKPGRYEAIVELADHPGKLTLPFEVREKEWPTFSAEEIQFARSNPKVPISIGARVQCPGCERTYLFEESLLDDFEPNRDAFVFPDSGEFHCLDCEHTLQIRDLHGQARAMLKSRLRQAMEKS